MSSILLTLFFFFFNDTATTEIYTLSLHDALPIHHVQRLIPRRDGPHAAHGHVHRHAGAVAAAGHDVYARHPGLDRLHRVGRRDLRDLLGGDRRDRAGQIAPLLGAVPDDDDALELYRSCDELEVERDRLPRGHLHRERERRESQEPHADQLCPGRRVGDLVPAGRLRRGRAVGTDHRDGRARDGAPVLGGGDGAGDPALGSGLGAKGDADGRQNQYAASHHDLPDGSPSLREVIRSPRHRPILPAGAGLSSRRYSRRAASSAVNLVPAAVAAVTLSPPSAPAAVIHRRTTLAVPALVPLPNRCTSIDDPGDRLLRMTTHEGFVAGTAGATTRCMVLSAVQFDVHFPLPLP